MFFFANKLLFVFLFAVHDGSQVFFHDLVKLPVVVVLRAARVGVWFDEDGPVWVLPVVVLHAALYELERMSVSDFFATVSDFERLDVQDRVVHNVFRSVFLRVLAPR